MSLRVLIADDEPIAIERLKISLACIPEVELVGCATTGREARSLARDLAPDAVLLDINMPGMSGLDAATALGETAEPPIVIFLTAHAEYAVAAFALRAVDYLLKPVSLERLREAVKRAEEAIRLRTVHERLAQVHETLQSLQSREAAAGTVHRKEFWVRSGDGLVRYGVEHVDRIEAEGDYVCIRIGEASHLLKLPITALERELDPACFARVHRSTIVNLARVRALRRRGRSGMSLSLLDGSSMAVGPSYAEKLMIALQAKRWR